MIAPTWIGRFAHPPRSKRRRLFLTFSPPDIVTARRLSAARLWSPCPTPRSKPAASAPEPARSEEHTSELQSRRDLVCRLLLEKKKKKKIDDFPLHKTIKKKQTLL